MLVKIPCTKSPTCRGFAAAGSIGTISPTGGSAPPSSPENRLVASSSSQAVRTNGAVSADTLQVLSTLEMASMTTTDTAPPRTT